MDDNLNLALRQARDYLRQGNPDAARPLLVGVLKDDPKNEHAWYMLAFVYDQPDRRRYALEQVLRINPENQKARQKLQAFESQVQGIAAAPLSEPSAPAAKMPAPEKMAKKARSRQISTGLLVLLIAGVLIVL